MASDPQLPLQKAIYDLLSGDVTLDGLVSGVFDNVPEGTAYPYVSIGDDVLSDWGSHTFDGASCDVSVHSWARELGRKSVKDIMARVYTLLHNVDLSVSGFSTVACRMENEQTFLDPDGETYHGVQRFKIILGG